MGETCPICSLPIDFHEWTCGNPSVCAGANLANCYRLGYERSQAALAAARRECEGLRKRVREVRADMTPTNMQYEAHFLRQWIVSWAKKLDAALAAPAAGDSK